MQLISFTTFFVIKRILGILKDKTFIQKKINLKNFSPFR